MLGAFMDYGRLEGIPGSHCIVVCWTWGYALFLPWVPLIYTAQPLPKAPEPDLEFWIVVPTPLFWIVISQGEVGSAFLVSFLILRPNTHAISNP